MQRNVLSGEEPNLLKYWLVSWVFHSKQTKYTNRSPERADYDIVSKSSPGLSWSGSNTHLEHNQKKSSRHCYSAPIWAIHYVPTRYLKTPWIVKLLTLSQRITIPSLQPFQVPSLYSLCYYPHLMSISEAWPLNRELLKKKTSSCFNKKDGYSIYKTLLKLRLLS